MMRQGWNASVCIAFTMSLGRYKTGRIRRNTLQVTSVPREMGRNLRNVKRSGLLEPMM
jgi:hypothetical protein